MMQVETTAPTELTHSALRADAARGVAKPSYRRLPWIMPHAIDPLTRFAVGRLGLDHDGVRVLEIKGRTSGLWRATPVRVLDLNGQQYLVAPQGETQWVRNLRVQRRGRLRLGGRVTDFKAEELSDQDKVPVLRAYFRRWWSQAARLTALTSADAPDVEVRQAAYLHPAFLISAAGGRVQPKVVPMWRRTGIRAPLVALDAFTALTAIAGGIALATGLEGDRFPIELLRGTRFGSYVVPGLILGVVVGGSAAVATVAGLRRPRLVAQTSALAGIVLMGWTVGEVLILPPAMRSWVETGYFGVGLMMAGLGLVVWMLDHRHARTGVGAGPHLPS